jgi:hypothetical protein
VTIAETPHELGKRRSPQKRNIDRLEIVVQIGMRYSLVQEHTVKEYQQAIRQFPFKVSVSFVLRY